MKDIDTLTQQKSRSDTVHKGLIAIFFDGIGHITGRHHRYPVFRGPALTGVGLLPVACSSLGPVVASTR